MKEYLRRSKYAMTLVEINHVAKIHYPHKSFTPELVSIGVRTLTTRHQLIVCMN